VPAYPPLSTYCKISARHTKKEAVVNSPHNFTKQIRFSAPDKYYSATDPTEYFSASTLTEYYSATDPVDHFSASTLTEHYSATDPAGHFSVSALTEHFSASAYIKY